MVEVPLIRDMLASQMGPLAKWAGLAPDLGKRVERLLLAIGGPAFSEKFSYPFPGLSRINAGGLPLQWCAQVQLQKRALGVLCEGGRPGSSAEERAHGILAALMDGGNDRPALGAECGKVLLRNLLPQDDESWPVNWRSAVWVAVAAAGSGLLVKPYFNLNRGSPRERWMRVGKLLHELGRDAALSRLCRLSRHAPEGSSPVGLAVDLLEGDGLGRVKMYFRSPAHTGMAWLEQWYAAVDAPGHYKRLLSALEELPGNPGCRAPGAYVLSAELFDGGEVSLKTDVAVTKWNMPETAVRKTAKAWAENIGSPSTAIDEVMDCFSGPATGSEDGPVRFLGLGHEPDGSRHLNIYIEPPPPAAFSGPQVERADRMDRKTRTLRRALEGLADIVDEDGFWRDFHSLPIGPSDAWVTAFVLTCVAQASLSEEDSVWPRALDVLETRGAQKQGWGYNATVAADADSTSWARLAFLAHRRLAPASTTSVLLDCSCPSGGIATYPPGVEGGGNWSRACAEVTAMALAAWPMGAPPDWRRKASGFLKDAQGADGLWTPFWWNTPLYPAWVALNWGGAEAGPRNSPLRQSLLRYRSRTPFEESLSLSCLAAAGEIDAAQAAMERLIASQCNSGLWTGSAPLRLRSRNREEDDSRTYTDAKGIFTTATAIYALAAFDSKLPLQSNRTRNTGQFYGTKAKQ